MTQAASPSFHLGLVGWPLAHSLSPQMHTAALQSAGLAGDYRLFPVTPFPLGEPELKEILERVRCGEIQGLNVTIPHKQNAIKYMDTLSPAAQSIGAVNTISLQNGSLHGDNTDWTGFLHDLENQMPSGALTGNKKALILGAGGSARAVVYALLQSGWQISIFVRRLEQAQQLAADFSSPGQAVNAFPTVQINGLSETTLIVNSTPLGMFPEIQATPWPLDLPFPRHAFLYDLIYNPSETALMKTARSAGLQSANGLGMLVEQAALAFEIWTGQSVSREVMRQAALERKLI